MVGHKYKHVLLERQGMGCGGENQTGGNMTKNLTVR